MLESIHTQTHRHRHTYTDTQTHRHTDTHTRTATLLQVVLSEGVRQDLPGAADAVWQLYQQTPVAAVKDTCLAALSSSLKQAELSA